MKPKHLLIIFIFLIFHSFYPVFAGSPDDNSNASINNIASSSFTSFVDSMDDIGLGDIYFKRANDPFKSEIEKKFDISTKANNANKIYELFQAELEKNPIYAFKIYNEALISLYDLSPRTFKNNSEILKNSLIEILSNPNQSETNIIYTNELDCGNPDNYEPCKKLYQNKLRLPFMLLLMLPVFI